MLSKKTFIYIAAPLILLLVFVLGNSNGGMEVFSSSSRISKFNKKQNSIDDPSSLWVIVNKKRSLNPTTFIPNDLIAPRIPLRFTDDNEEMKLRRPAAEALEKMTADAKKAGLSIMLASGYRSYSLQTIVYNNFVSTQGKDIADTQSARPGFSEHQTGLAADLEPINRSCEIEDCFAETSEGKWLATNSYKYGFILRYPSNAQSIVGYKYEPWHFRFIGRELATELHKQNNQTMESFFGLPASPNYN